jgi:uncharacterized RDD family membrane protein YckC
MEPSLVTSDEADYAGFWIRTCALAIDALVVWFLMLVEFLIVVGLWELGLLPMTSKELGEGLGVFLAVMFWGFPAWPYYAILESSKMQATVGKRLFGLRVTDLEGQRIGIVRASVRHWAKVASHFLLFMGWVMAAFSSRKQGLHDLMAGTLVVWG